MTTVCVVRITPGGKFPTLGVTRTTPGRAYIIYPDERVVPDRVFRVRHDVIDTHFFETIKEAAAWVAAR